MSKQVAQQAVAPRLLPKQPEVNIGTSGHVDHGKCLRFDQYALVNGVPMTGQEIMDIVSAKGRLVSRLDGEQVYEFEGSDVVSVSPSLKATSARSLFFVQEYEGTIQTVRTSTGRSISVTPRHPLLVNRKGRLLWVRTEELVAGDHVAFLSQIPLPRVVEFNDPFPGLRAEYKLVDWLDYQRLFVLTDGFQVFGSLNPEDLDQLRILAGFAESTFSRMIGADWERWKKVVSKGTRLTEEIRKRVGDVLTGATFTELEPGEFLAVQRSRYARHIRKLKDFDFDDDLAKWFAFVWSEGNSLPGKIVVTQTEEKRMLKEFLRITKTKLGQDVAQYEGGQYAIHRKVFVDYLRLKFGFTPGDRFESPIASWVCRLPLEWKATFLRWFLSLDGGFYRGSGQISIAQANPRNVVMMSYMLASFGIVSRFDAITRRVKAGPRQYARLNISGRRNLQLFAQNIGFESARKQRALLRYLGEIKQDSKESDLSIPVDSESLRQGMKRIGLLREGFEPSEAIQSAKRMSWYEAYEGLRLTGRVSRRKLTDMVESMQNHLDAVRESMLRVSKRKEPIRRHIELIGVSLGAVADHLGMSRKKLVRILERGGEEETRAVADHVLGLTQELLREGAAFIGQLRTLASTPLEFDCIKAITSERYSGRVFDLSVPEHANFVGGVGGIVSHNTSLTQAVTGVWASAHSEELKRGITIKVGYADTAFYRCPKTPEPAAYSTSAKCPVCGEQGRLLRAVSFVDCPGHESLMTNMLAGAFLMDGALLVIAANEPVPKPQTREHLQALQMLGMKRIVIAQNKVDLVTDQEAKKNYQGIRKFVEKTVAADAPIVPISAQQRTNIDALIEAIEEVIPTPARDAGADPLMYVVRSFDVNRPGATIPTLSGGVLGGSLTRGELKVGEEIELRPGMVDERSGKYVPIVTKVASLQTGAGETEKVGPGGLVALGTELDPTFIKGDQMVGSVIGKPGTLPPNLEHMTMEVSLLETAVGSAELVTVEKAKPGETLRLNIGTASTQAVVTSARGGTIEVDLKRPVTVEAGMRAALSRRIAERWRLIGSGVLR